MKYINSGAPFFGHTFRKVSRVQISSGVVNLLSSVLSLLIVEVIILFMFFFLILMSFGSVQ